MQVIHEIFEAHLTRDTVLTIGAFDGIHLGHQAILRRIMERARESGLLGGLVTFEPHPRAVLAPTQEHRYLTTLAEKLALLQELGLDFCTVLPFSREMATQPASVFVASLRERLHMRELWVGPDFALGRNREGDVEALHRIAEEQSFTLRVIPPVTQGEQAISSTQIRQLLRAGDVAETARLLGRHYHLTGLVGHGVGRGRKLGFRTANQIITCEKLIPPNGVYAVFVELGAEHYMGATNIGTRLSFGESECTVETFILDFDRDIYGQELSIQFVARLRQERRFENTAALVAQIKRDCDRAREVLAGAIYTPSPMARRERTMNEQEQPFREIAHTADLALQVRAETLPELYANAARGMFYLMSGTAETPPRTHEHLISLQGPDYETLLVDWLNELLYLADREREIMVDFNVETLTPTRLEARVGATHNATIRKAIKAATFHDLRITPLHPDQDPPGYLVNIVFDV
mgnify:CR=1 FL=1